MGRELPILTAQAAESQTAETHDIMDVTLPEVRLADGTILAAVPLYLAAAKLARTIELNTVVYQPAIRKIADLKISDGDAPDGGSFELTNLEGLYGELLFDPVRTLDGAEAVIYRAFLTSRRGDPKVYDFDEMMRGTLRGVGVNQQTVSFSFVRDWSDPAALVVTRSLTQRCLAVFEDENCGHIGAPAGAVCSHIKDDAAAGCRFWLNEPRFYGVPPIAPNAERTALGTVPGGRPADPNFGYGPGTRPEPRSPHFDPDWRDPFRRVPLMDLPL
jgi:hypothetical protein